MLRWAAAICVVALVQAVGIAASAWNESGWFMFRDAVLERGSPFVRGVRAFVFYDWALAERELRVAASASQATHAAAAQAYLCVIFERMGRHRDALAAINELLRRQHVKPAQVESHPGRTLQEFLSAYPDQRVIERHLTSVRFSRTASGHIVVPVAIDAKTTSCLIDTGAEDSSLPESEAVRLGLKIHKIDRTLPTAGGGALHLTGVTVADHFAIGGFRLENVPFTIVREESDQAFGTIGMNVLLALQTFGWTLDGNFEVGFPAGPRNPGAANICLGESGTLLTEIESGQKRLTASLDTGAAESFLKAGFARHFGALVRQSGSKAVYDPGFIGRPVQRLKAVRLPEVRLTVGGCDMAMRNVPVLLKQFWGETWNHAHIGIDLLDQRRVSIDLSARQLRVEDCGTKRKLP